MSKPKAVPDGYHTLTPFLNLKDADKAIEFYQKAFGAEVKMVMPGPGGKVMHAELTIGDSIVMLSEAMRQAPASGGIHIYVNDADALFNRAVAAGAKVETPLQNMFWGDRFGQLSDPFGVHWSIAAHIEDVPAAEMETRAQEAMKRMQQTMAEQAKKN